MFVNLRSPDLRYYEAAKAHWNSIAKPLGSLGLLEDAVCAIAAVQKTAEVDISSRAAVVMCADNGVVCEGVSQSDSSVTALCADEIAEGRSNINALADAYGVRVIAADVGISGITRSPRIIRMEDAVPAGNIAVGAAFTREHIQKILRFGMDIAGKLAGEGTKIIVSGEMGIGNTTSAAASASVLLGIAPAEAAGRGAGLDNAGLARKINAIERAIYVNSPDKGDALDILSKVGGGDIAGMTGLFLGGAKYGIPVVIDGMISAAAALFAFRIAPECRHYMLASHVSAEPAGKLLLDALGLKPLITAEMRLGEGTGGVMLLPLLDGALAVYRNSHRFDDIGLERYTEK